MVHPAEARSALEPIQRLGAAEQERRTEFAGAALPTCAHNAEAAVNVVALLALSHAIEGDCQVDGLWPERAGCAKLAG